MMVPAFPYARQQGRLVALCDCGIFQSVQTAHMSPAEMMKRAEAYEAMAGWADQLNRTRFHEVADNWRKVACQVEALERSSVYRMIRRASHPHPEPVLRAERAAKQGVGA
ncbi:hypothetical protein [Bradyrhizobium sp. USDA 4451]